MNDIHETMRAALQQVANLNLIFGDFHPDGPDTATITIENFATLCEAIDAAQDALALADEKAVTA